MHVRDLLARASASTWCTRSSCVRRAYWPDAAGPPVVLDLIDALSENFARRAAHDRGPLALVSAFEGARLRAYEQALVARAAATLVVAEPDRRALGGARVRVVPNGVDLDASASLPKAACRDASSSRETSATSRIVDAARWLVEEILPAVQRSVPGASVHLAVPAVASGPCARETTGRVARRRRARDGTGGRERQRGGHRHAERLRACRTRCSRRWPSGRRS
jgi:hypothetical protein